MTLTRLLGFTLAFVLLLRLLPLIGPLLGPRPKRMLAHLAITIDVAGGLIVLGIVLLVLVRGEPLGALLLALIGLPVFWGAYRALPAWWRGSADDQPRTRR